MRPSQTGLPFDDIRALMLQLPEGDETAVEAVRQRDVSLTKPPGSLGKLEMLVEFLARWQGKAEPTVQRPLVAVFATNHGVADQNVSAYPQAVTRQMVENFAAGGAAINQICLAHGLGLKVFELALEHPTPDISLKDAFDEAGCAATIAYGMEAIAGGVDLVCLGEMGIANTTIASALYFALYGGQPSDWVGRGTGVDDEGLKNKERVLAEAIERLDGEQDALELLRRVGGREIAAMLGTILAARTERVPVIIDGFVSTAAAALLQRMAPEAIDHCLFSHASAEQAHRRVLEQMGKEPLLDLNMRLGEGTGAALAASLVQTAVKIHTGMATFDQAGVSDKESD